MRPRYFRQRRQNAQLFGETQKNILLLLLWAPTNVDEKHCQVCPKRLFASQEFSDFKQ